MSSVLVNTNLAAASGLIVAVIVARPIFGRLGLASSLNGALAGLVSITAAPNIAESWWAVIIGAVGGLLCSLATRLMERMKLDDVVGAIPVHLVAGVWGTLAASITTGAEFGVQLLGVASVAAFTFTASFIVWKAIDLTVGMRVSRDVEYVGQDVGELGIESHPEFMLVPEDFDDYRPPLESRPRRSRREARQDQPERPTSPGDRRMEPRQGAPPGQYGPAGAAPPGRQAPPGAAPPGRQAPPGCGPARSTGSPRRGPARSTGSPRRGPARSTGSPRSAGSPRCGSARSAGSPRCGSARSAGSPRRGPARSTGSPRCGSARSAGSPRCGSARSAGSPGAAPPGRQAPPGAAPPGRQAPPAPGG